MLRYRFTADDLAYTRFAVSPIWEAVLSVRVLRAPDRSVFHSQWARTTSLAAVRLPNWGLLAALVPQVGRLPDFLTPPPAVPLPDLDAQLSALAATDPAVVRRDLRRTYPRGIPDALTELYSRPSAGLRDVVTGLRAYWDLAIAELWPRTRALLEADIAHRSWTLSRGGASALFADLHPGITYNSLTLTVGDKADCEGILDGDGLVLVPSVFTWPDVLCIASPPMRPALFYPARGVAALWEASESESPAALADLLGGSRAKILSSLAAPVTTIDLARRLKLAPGGVSTHLSVLRRAGLAKAVRAGRSVLYSRTGAGEALIAAAEDRSQ